MKSSFVLPNNYTPFPRQNLCGNTLVNVTIPFEILGGVPLLIGRGDDPQIWLFPRPTAKGMPWQPVVKANFTAHPDVKVTGQGTPVLTVTVPDVVALEVTRDAPDAITVTQLDLRPLGFDIHGDRTGLTVGQHLLTNNTFANVRVMVGVGDEERRSNSYEGPAGQ